MHVLLYSALLKAVTITLASSDEFFFIQFKFVAYSRSVFCARYFQALTSNMGLLKYREVYAAAAEVLGLALQYIAERGNVSELYFVFDLSCLYFILIFYMTTQFRSKNEYI